MKESSSTPLSGDKNNDVFAFPHYTRPNSVDILFTSSGQRRNEVFLRGRDNDWDAYCLGYWRSADALVDHVIQTNNPSVERPYAIYWESQAYAILFLYRHYLELRLKEMYLACGGDLKQVNKAHGLLKLWMLVREQEKRVTQEETPDEVSDDMNSAENIIKEFDRIDVDSQAFRYPINRKGKTTIVPMELDLIRLQKALGWLSQFLDGWSCGIYEYTQTPIE